MSLADARRLPASTSYSAAQSSPQPAKSLLQSSNSLRPHTYNLQHVKCPRLLHTLVAASVAAQSSGGALVGVGEIADVEEVEGIRVLLGPDGRPLIQYLVKWKPTQLTCSQDEVASTWEPIENLADNLLRDFEDKWWRCCREGDEAALRALLDKSRDVLPHCVDTNERSALHFSAALGKADCCRALCEAGADVDQADKDGYTPLHMAVGYSHVATVRALLEAGANPEAPDNQGRDVVRLVDSIRADLPLSPQMAGKRVALEEVSALLTGNLFEETFPKKILESRSTVEGTKEFLVQWLDGAEDSWVGERDVADDVIRDFEQGYEYAEADAILKMKLRGDQRLFLVRWLDGRPSTWEFEDHLSRALVAAFDRAREGKEPLADLLPELPAASRPLSKRAARRERKAQRRAALGGAGNGSASASEANGSGRAGVNGAHADVASDAAAKETAGVA